MPSKEILRSMNTIWAVRRKNWTCTARMRTSFSILRVSIVRRTPAEFVKGNFGFASTLLDTLKKHGNTCPVMISSSIQASLDNPYGESKRAGEQLLFDYAEETGAKVLVYRFPNLFGKWCRPNYNSAVATFCNNIANDLPITVNDPSVVMHLVYIDDVVDELIGALTGGEHRDGDFCYVPASHRITLGGIVDLLHSFRRMPETLEVPDTTTDGFVKKLYSTYLSYLPEDRFAYDLKMNTDARGSFTEILRTADRGAVLGERLQTGHHQGTALAPYEEREIRGSARARAYPAAQGGQGRERQRLPGGQL